MQDASTAPSFEEYSAIFRSTAGADALQPEYVERCLQYARKHLQDGRAVVYSANHLSSLVGYDISYLYGVANSGGNYYRTFSVPKKSGGKRRISEPLPSLKEIQRWILTYILSPVQVHTHVKSFRMGYGLRANARFHRAQKIVLRLDVLDFFGSIRVKRVADFFLKLGYAKPVATLLAGVCTLNGKLPQGAPTSPALSNLVPWPVDVRLSTFARNEGIRYTRYADDMTFSGEFKPGKVISMASRVLRENGFQLNVKKTNVMGEHQRQLVTGVVVNEKLQVPRGVRRGLRKEVYYIEKFGLTEHVRRMGVSDPKYVSRLRGMAAHILAVNPNDEEAKNALRFLGSL
ncbi:MAG: RNA-directed DNA polymerase [Planctomycetaceae bacterium]|nr:RNA-directed DNA polymerase [Planctomycetaceae bacterium]